MTTRIAANRGPGGRLRELDARDGVVAHIQPAHTKLTPIRSARCEPDTVSSYFQVDTDRVQGPERVHFDRIRAGPGVDHHRSGAPVHEPGSQYPHRIKRFSANSGIGGRARGVRRLLGHRRLRLRVLRAATSGQGRGQGQEGEHA